MEDFDIQESVEKITSGALSSAITNVIVYILIAGVILFIIGRLIKFGVNTIQEKAATKVAVIAKREENKAKQIAWAERQRIFDSQQMKAFKRIAQETAETEERMRNIGVSNESPFAEKQWIEKITKTKETFEVLKSTKSNPGVSEDRNAIYKFILNSVVSQKGNKAQFFIEQENGNTPALTKQQFWAINEAILDSDEFERLSLEGSVDTTKRILGHEFNIYSDMSFGELSVEWLPRTIDKVEKIPTDTVDNPYGLIADMNIEGLAAYSFELEQNPYEGIVDMMNDSEDPYGKLIDEEVNDFELDVPDEFQR